MNLKIECELGQIAAALERKVRRADFFAVGGEVELKPGEAGTDTKGGIALIDTERDQCPFHQ